MYGTIRKDRDITHDRAHNKNRAAGHKHKLDAADSFGNIIRTNFLDVLHVTAEPRRMLTAIALSTICMCYCLCVQHI